MQPKTNPNKTNRIVLTVPTAVVETKLSSPLQQTPPPSQSYFSSDREMLFRPIKYDVDEDLGEQVVNDIFGDDFNDLESISSDDDDDILIIPPEVFILYTKNKKKKFFLKWKMYHYKIKSIKMKKQKEIDKIEEMKMNKAFQFYSKREIKKLFKLWRKLVFIFIIYYLYNRQNKI